MKYIMNLKQIIKYLDEIKKLGYNQITLEIKDKEILNYLYEYYDITLLPDNKIIIENLNYI